MYLASGELCHPTSVVQNLGDDLAGSSITFALDDHSVSVAVKTEDVYATSEFRGDLATQDKHFQSEKARICSNPRLKLILVGETLAVYWDEYTILGVIQACHGVSILLASPVRLREQPTLSFRKLHGRGARFVVVHHGIDPRANGIASHEPGIIGLQQIGDRRSHILHSRIEPQVVGIWIENDG